MERGELYPWYSTRATLFSIMIIVVRTDAGGSTEAIAAFGKKECGLYGQPCLLDYHAQYFSTPADGKMAAFLLGMNKYAQH